MSFFESWPLPANAVAFVVAACAVWFAGIRVAQCADEFGRRYGVGEAVLGVLMLATVTSLPEIATSVTAAAKDNAALAVNNLLGSIAMQVAVIALADFMVKRRALTAVLPDPIVFLQGALNALLLSFVAIGVLVEDRPLWGAGYWTWGLAVATALCFWKITDTERQPQAWVRKADEPALVQGTDDKGDAEKLQHAPAWRLGVRTLAAALTILVAGSIVSLTGDAIAAATGLGSSFMGLAFVAIATSLPEVSTALAAVRIGHYTMAISGIFGTNVLNVGLLFVVDAVAPGEPVLNRVGTFSAVGAMLGIALTSVYAMGLAERRDRVFGRLGTDSIIVLSVYFTGMCLLYTLRGSA